MIDASKVIQMLKSMVRLEERRAVKSCLRCDAELDNGRCPACFEGHLSVMVGVLGWVDEVDHGV